MVGRNLLENAGFCSHDVVSPGRSELDLLDADSVASAVRRIRPTLVVHAAGRVGGIGANQANQAAFLMENALMGINLARAAAEADVPRFLNISSSCVYPREAQNPLAEESLFSGPLEPTNEGYAIAKLTVLRFGEFLAAQRENFQWVSLIPPNLYGRWDHFEAERSHLVPAVIRKLHEAKVRGSSTVEIWGDGTARREFMLAADFAECVSWAISEMDRLPQRLNVGIGMDHSVDEYYAIAADVVGFEGTFSHDLSRPVGMRQKLVGVDRMRALGWTPGSDLVAGLRSTYEFFLEHES